MKGRTTIGSGSDRPLHGLDLAGDHFVCGVFASTAAVGDGQIALHLRQRTGAAIDDFPDLAVTDAVAKTDVHATL